MGAYPARMNIEVGTWLTQKGYFANAAFLMEVSVGYNVADLSPSPATRQVTIFYELLLFSDLL